MIFLLNIVQSGIKLQSSHHICFSIPILLVKIPLEIGD